MKLVEKPGPRVSPDGSCPEAGDVVAVAVRGLWGLEELCGHLCGAGGRVCRDEALLGGDSRLVEGGVVLLEELEEEQEGDLGVGVGVDVQGALVAAEDDVLIDLGERVEAAEAGGVGHDGAQRHVGVQGDCARHDAAGGEVGGLVGEGEAEGEVDLGGGDEVARHGVEEEQVDGEVAVVDALQVLRQQHAGDCAAAQPYAVDADARAVDEQRADPLHGALALLLQAAAEEHAQRAIVHAAAVEAHLELGTSGCRWS